MKTHAVRISDDSLVFSSAHFITYDDGEVESLHGHDFRVSVEISQPLSPGGGYVLDFTQIRKTVRDVLKRLDHKTLLAGENPHYALDVHETVDPDFDPMQEYLEQMKSQEEFDLEQGHARELGMTPTPDEVWAGIQARAPMPAEVEVEVRYRHKRWVFPSEDCEILPIANTTAELLAEYIAGQIRASALLATDAWTRIRVELCESNGMTGIFEDRR